MKFSTFACLVLASVASVDAFAPSTPRAFVGAPVTSADVVKSARSTTELNMGLRSFFSRSKTTSSSQGITKDITEDQVRSLFYLWNSALATGDSKIVAKRYSKDPILLPTVSDTPRTDFASIKDYFDAFLQKKPQGQIVEGQITIGDGWAMDAGIYDFTMGIDGSKVRARYSYVYKFEGGEWKIAHHHSSVMPEGISIGTPITENEVRNLFYLWNDALATEDAATVASRYSKEAVLLPTVSDVPRTSNALITDYFKAFCQKKPQGTILESNVIIGTNWAQDAGIYEFTMGADGSKVKARYTFIYVFEDGQWKISHHHSSMMPEGTLPQAITKEEVRAQFGRWNDALATLDSKKVADRYSKNAVLLPTVSDTPRTDYALIKDYFDAFLLKKPQGVILEGDIIIGHNWAQDAGIYEFTMGATGDKVKARYSYVYVYEDGDWKISHHHSSVMPEAFLGPAKPAEEKEAVSA
uniref:Calcium/calmodulin-dependent protein kinase II association-domain domain-containing protein n=1 Tax=Pseudictyota dubia TaxID=2749911 RepID=A0A7R9VN03_9STRA